MPFTSNDLEIIIGLFPEVMNEKEEVLMKKLVLIKKQIDTNNEFQEKMLAFRKEFESLNKD